MIDVFNNKRANQPKFRIYIFIDLMLGFLFVCLLLCLKQSFVRQVLGLVVPQLRTYSCTDPKAEKRNCPNGMPKMTNEAEAGLS